MYRQNTTCEEEHMAEDCSGFEVFPFERKNTMTDDLYNSFPLSEDDIVVNLRFSAVFRERQPLLSFQEEWVINRIRKHFGKYTFHNSVRLNAIEVRS